MTVSSAYKYNFAVQKYTISVQTLGCKLNQAEAESFARSLAAAGHLITAADEADVFILNTCTVTHIADRKSRHTVRLLRKKNPQAYIVVTGCYAERAAEELKQCGADLVAGNEEKESLPSIVDSILSGGSAACIPDRRIRAADRVRSFIKIQDGCRNYCSYCIVPFVRQNVRSLDAGMIIREIQDRTAGGYKEVVLTGTEIGIYRHEGQDLPGLLQRILKETSVERLHLSSLQPAEITPSLLDLWEDSRLYRHFHIALQSGSDIILKKMRRRYDKACFRQALNMIRDIIPGTSVTTDVMVGFPGEGEAEFRESYEFCREMNFAAMHVFPYSPRPGTAALGMAGKVPEKIKKERSRQMLELAALSLEQFARNFTGTVSRVLWENEVRQGSGIYSGLTGNYIRAYARSTADLTNSITEARLIGPAMEMDARLLKLSTKGNYGEFWSEVIA